MRKTLGKGDIALLQEAIDGNMFGAPVVLRDKWERESIYKSFAVR